MNPLDNDTIVSTPDGWKLLNGLKAGDRVLTGTGQLTSIAKVEVGLPSVLYEIITQDNRVVSAPHSHLWTIYSIGDQAEVALSANDLYYRQLDGDRHVLRVHRPATKLRYLGDFLRTLPDAKVLYQGGQVVAIEFVVRFDPANITRLRESLWSYGAVLHIQLDVPRSQVRINADFRRWMDFSIRRTDRHCHTRTVKLSGMEQTLLAKDYLDLTLLPRSA